MPKVTVTPQELKAEADALKDQWIAKEAEAIRAALEECDWFEAPAARLLGLTRSTLKQLLLTRHAPLGKEAAQRRKEGGYKTGRPALEKK